MKVFLSQRMSGKTTEEIKQMRLLAMESVRKIFDTEDIEFIDNIDIYSNALFTGGKLLKLGRSIELMHDADFVYFDFTAPESPACHVHLQVCKLYGIPYGGAWSK